MARLVPRQARYPDGRELPAIVSTLDRLGNVSCVGLLLASWWLWRQLPATVPIHYAPTGRPDGWGDRSVLLILPAIAIGLYWMLTALARHPGLHGSVNVSSSNPAERDRQFFLAVRVRVPAIVSSESGDREHRVTRPSERSDDSRPLVRCPSSVSAAAAA